MRLADFERTDDGRYVTRVPDAAGKEEFELRIAGPGKLVKEMLGDATIELTIDSSQDESEVESQVRQKFDSAHKEHRRSVWELAALDDIEQLLKPSPPPPERDSSVFTSIRPVSGEGTPFEFEVRGFFVPAGRNLNFYCGPGTWRYSSLFPASGDQDLFLSLGPIYPIVSSSTLPGTSLDRVWFAAPILIYQWQFWVRVFGFTTGTCSRFWITGF